MKIFFYIIFLFSFVANRAIADIYRSVSKDGVECFTDAPVNRNSILVIREHRKIKASKLDSKRIVSAGTRKLQSTTLVSKPKSFVLPVKGVISSTVGLRYDPIDGMLRDHKGVDIAIPEGTPIKPVATGIVSYSGMRGGYGNIVIIEHDSGMTTLYAHNNINWAESGDRVDENTTIALSGSTGRSTGPHLHFEAWLEGQNVTSDFFDDPSSIQRYPSSKMITRKVSFIRKVVKADGSILLTNLPLVHP
ncbi:MAG: M23 family metallopeptidase [Geobacter sp.]|nr:MAG: M23 family metallopeptidase [Geobacter sp.]